MKRLVLSILVLSVFIGFSGCSNSKDNLQDSLQKSVDKYSKCMIDNDFKCQAKFLDPAPFKKMGVTVDQAIEGLKANASAVKLINLTMHKPSKIIKDGKALHSTVTYSMDAKVHGQEIKTDAELNIVSYDNGSSWLFSSKY